MGRCHEIHQIFSGDFWGPCFVLVEVPMDSMISTNYKNNDIYSITRDKYSSQDSGWSLYVEDPLIHSNMEDAAVSSEFEFSSIFSDDSSLDEMIRAGENCATSTMSVHKRRTEVTFIDPDLEDTASSPVSSAKVYDLDTMLGHLQETRYCLNMLKNMEQPSERGNCSVSHSQEMGNSFNQTDETLQSGFIGNNICYKGLKERGLCLVPVSLLFRC